MTGEYVGPLLIGGRYGHHADHSGYERSFVGVGTPLVSTSWRWQSWRIEPVVARLAKSEIYSSGAFVTELRNAPSILRRRHAQFHYIYGETDAWLLPSFAARTKQPFRFSASLHLPPERFRELSFDFRRLRNANHLILVSESQVELVTEALPGTPTTVVPINVDSEFFTPTAPEDADEAAPFYLCVGSHLRDHALLVESFDAARTHVRLRTKGPALRLLLVGAPPEVCKLAGRHDDVEIVGRISDEELRTLYRRCVATVLPLRHATASLAALEALSCGAHIITTEHAGTREYLREFAVYLPPSDSRLLSDAMIAALEAPTTNESVKASRHSHAATFDETIAQARMRTLFQSL